MIGGSGLYAMQGLQQAQELQIDTPYGPTSDAIVVGRLGQARVAFLARHACGHKLLPSEIPFLANVWALKSLRVRYLLSVSAVGSLIEKAASLDLVLPEQFIDHTRGRSRRWPARTASAAAGCIRAAPTSASMDRSCPPAGKV